MPNDFHFANENDISSFFLTFWFDSNSEEIRDSWKNRLKSFLIEKDELNTLEHPAKLEPDEIKDKNLFWKTSIKLKDGIYNVVFNYYNSICEQGVNTEIKELLKLLKTWITTEWIEKKWNPAYDAITSLQKNLNQDWADLNVDWKFGPDTYQALNNKITKLQNAIKQQQDPEKINQTEEQRQQQILQELKSTLEPKLEEWNNERIPWKAEFINLITSWKEEDIRYIQLMLKPEYKWKIDWKYSNNLIDAINLYTNTETRKSIEYNEGNNKVIPLVDNDQIHHDGWFCNSWFYNLNEDKKEEAFVSVDWRFKNDTKILYLADWSEFRYKAIELKWDQKVTYVWRFEKTDGKERTLSFEPSDLKDMDTFATKCWFTGPEKEKYYNIFKIFNGKFLAELNKSNND